VNENTKWKNLKNWDKTEEGRNVENVKRGLKKEKEKQKQRGIAREDFRR
jgi:hypothetical protein